MTRRDPATGRFAKRPAPPAPPARPVPVERYRVANSRGPLSDWFGTWDAAKAEAIRLGLTEYDQTKREHYLAVPIRIETGRS